ncbi:tetratricopeptide repeat protein [Mucisphaera sp.]|uniref:tetratricopeptide repeat protein n=1 Tax=Mucisphaera sp. TaxID=2913024 RepID=UPI003D10FD92
MNPAERDRAGLDRAIERLQAQLAEGGALASRHLLARLLMRAGRLGEAYEQYKDVASDRRATVGMIEEAAYCAERVGDLDGAETGLRATLEIEASVSLRTRLAEVQLARGDWVSAGWTAWRVTREDETYTQAWAVLAAVGWVTGRRGVAGEAIARLRQLDPEGGSNRVGACLARVVPGMMQEKLNAGGTPEDAATRGDRWRSIERMKLDGSSATAWERLMVHSSRALLSEARRKPGHADAWYHLAQADLAVGDRAGAIDALSRALVVNPGYRAALSSLRKIGTRRQAA